MKNFWIPIQNGSLASTKSSSLALMSQTRNFQEFNLTPMMLSIIILFVFSSLVALIYGLVHSYKTLTQLQYEEELGEHLVCSQVNLQTINRKSTTIPSAGASAMLEETDLEQFEPLLSNKLIIAADDISSRCHCFKDLETGSESIQPHYMSVGQQQAKHTTSHNAHDHHNSEQHLVQIIDKDANQFYYANSLSVPESRGIYLTSEEIDLLVESHQSSKVPFDNNNDNNDHIDIIEDYCDLSTNQFNEFNQKSSEINSTMLILDDRKQNQSTSIIMVKNPVSDELSSDLNYVELISATNDENTHKQIDCLNKNKEYYL